MIARAGTVAVELPVELRESCTGAYLRADRVAEARGRLRRGESPCDDELARAIVASAVLGTGAVATDDH